jgi:transposase
MIFHKKGLEIFILREPIDMRYGFHKLTGLVRLKYGMQKLLDGHVFMFFGNNRTRLKILFFVGATVRLR